ncbi:KTSC domain-containing protein [Shouchella patagoniensis]|uniref:KTSC domain-containing protein n=1 Tax=Shouchella patagoniensis TaxID=228576 RepID=UPI0009954BD2|nr:KTSC domain-containing protein [Shouchella patagoniensis]
MQRQYVSSSRMRSVGWANNTLEIEFKDGAVYQYHGVTEAEYRDFMNSSSLGSALSRLDKIHPYNRV